MWCFFPDCMVSVVAHNKKRGHLLVRARLPGHIERLLPRAKVSRTPGHDYLYRAIVTRASYAKAIARRAESIDYHNVKGACVDPAYHSAMFAVWSAMARHQDGPPLGVLPGQLAFDDWSIPEDDEPELWRRFI
jgi:hypothetical protein